jgi:2',3'-cyclic-nucleotide 2'-phosphodiesterase (5'-nucleotidase family)
MTIVEKKRKRLKTVAFTVKGLLFSHRYISKEMTSVTLQLLLINDVYELTHLPHLAACKRIESTHHTTVALLAGDVVAPSLLSSIDHGAGMVDCLNAAGIDYVCLGNHESDIPFHSLNMRLTESTFTWLNSNMPEMPLEPGVPLMPDRAVLTVSSTDGSHTRRIALPGLCGDDRTVLKPGAFGGCAIQPLQDTAHTLYTQLRPGLDAVVPMTHQLIALDRALAAARIGFPLMTHTTFLENFPYTNSDSLPF